uniref:Tumor necrosis factor receptor superfamily member 1A-like n=1 Tax=Pogona vitticeps TaxID=103695 RepID=A0A6J0T9J1_9SAUR
MAPLGLVPVFLAVVELSLIQMKAGEALGTVLIPDNIQRTVSDKQASLHSSGRGRRELVTCSIGEYLHPNGSHCCMKCHKGTYVAEHCSGQDKATKCAVCRPNAFMSIENYSDKCFGCGRCRSSFGQITISSCTPERDTVCGCGENQYQTSDKPEFFCKKCSRCQNGTIRQDCTKFKDTICECLPGFFLRKNENSCSPCTSCNSLDCEPYCKEPLPVMNPSSSQQVMFVLSSLVIIFGACCIFFLTRKIAKQYRQKKQKPSSDLFSLTPESMREPTSKVADCTLLVPPLETKQLTQLTASVPLPDCVRSAEKRQIPNRPEVLYAIMEQVPPIRWKEFIRYLGLKENVVERITIEQHSFREAQYEMLRHWRLQAGQDATVERISNALNQMELNGCSEAIQEALANQH